MREPVFPVNAMKPFATTPARAIALARDRSAATAMITTIAIATATATALPMRATADKTHAITGITNITPPARKAITTRIVAVPARVAGGAGGSESLMDHPSDVSDLERAGTDLFDFAVDRGDLASLLALWSAAAADRNRIEFELQLLKMIAVGWSLSYYLEGKPYRQPLMEFYWQAVNRFAHQLSATTGLMIGPVVDQMTGQAFDCFQILKNRMDRYLAAMTGADGAAGPETIIGPEFARICDRADDAFTLLVGTKMFANATTRVGEYLKANRLL